MNWNMQRLGREGDPVRHVLIVGANGRAAHLMQALSAANAPPCVFEGFLDDDPGRREVLERWGAPYLGVVDDFDRLANERVIDGVYVCLPLRSSYDTAERILAHCEMAGIPAYLVADLLPLHAESDAAWCMEPAAPAESGRPAQTEKAPLFATLSAAVAGLLPASVVPPRHRNESHPAPPYKL